MNLLQSHGVTQRVSGAIYLNGRVRGRISGIVDAEIHGVVHGDVSAIIASGSYRALPEEGADGAVPTAPPDGDGEKEAVCAQTRENGPQGKEERNDETN